MQNEEIKFENPLEDVIFDRLGNIFSFNFPKRNLKVRIDQVRQDRYTGADVRIEYLEPLQFQSHHIFQSKMNIDQASGQNGKSSVVKTCHNRADDLSYEEWDAIVEYVCVSVLESLREDELAPAINLRELPEAKDEGMLVTPLFPANDISMIFGEGGTGKSMLALWIAGLISEGFEFDWIAAKKQNVLYLDYETSEDEFKKRGDSLSKGLGLDEPFENIWYRRYNEPLIDMVENMREEIHRNNIGFGIVDSAGYACPEPESSKETNKFFKAMRTFPQVTWLVIAHTSKENIAKKTPFGSVFWWNGARSVWEIKKSQEQNDDNINSVLHHRKVNNGKLQKTIGFGLKFIPGAVMVNNSDITEIENYSQVRSRMQEIYGFLAKVKDKQTLNEIMHELEIDQSKANSVRASMSRNDELQHFGNGLWGIKGRNYDSEGPGISRKTMGW